MKKALVVLSGGMDSAICLSLALKKLKKNEILALTFDYQQRHKNELKQAKKIAKFFQVDQKIISLDFLPKITNNSLVNHKIKIKNSKSIPNTMVLGRNGLMARIAAIQATTLGAKIIYMGVMELENANSGYRDCSRLYMDVIQKALRIDFNNKFEIRTPLIKMTKKETMDIAYQNKVLKFLLENTLTCYEGKMFEGCGKCPACKLRNEGVLAFLKSHPDFEFSFKRKL